MLADANVVRLYSEIVAKLLGAGARGTGPFEQPMLLQDGNRRSLSEENKKGGGRECRQASCTCQVTNLPRPPGCFVGNCKT